MRNVIEVYKNIGETPLEAVRRFKRENREYADEKMTYAGRLDPMAEGLLVLLAGSAVYEKESYTELDKTYEFDVLLGVSTDTGDVLGIIQNVNSFSFDEDKFVSSLKTFEGVQIQEYPMYSSKTVDGMPLWKNARDGWKLENIPTHEIEIYTLGYLSYIDISAPQVLSSVLGRIDMIKGDFRQEEIKNSWEKNLNKARVFTVVKVRASVSSGTYIRVLAESIGKKLGIPALAFSIKRTSIGDMVV